MSEPPSAGGYDYAPATLNKDGTPPVTRMRDAAKVVDFVRRLWDNDQKRSWKRSLVNGLVGGNPPYRAGKLRDAGRADACNVNWGTARMYLESGSGAFYDLSTEAPGLVEVRTSHGTDEQKDYASRIMSAEVDRILQESNVWDFEVQVSQEQMTSHGRGPFLFEDKFKVLPIAVHDADLKVPERTRADTEYWETASVDRDYYAPELYAFVKDEAAARLAGWDVEFTQKVISNAMGVRQPEGQTYSWEFYQQEIKNNSLSYYDDSLVIHAAHVFWKEFDGRVTHAIVERDTGGTGEAKYLFFSVGRHDNFQQAIHPMYFDRGQGGFHHSVTGLGVKMYGAMEYENRLMCRLMDGAFAPKIMFKPSSAEAGQKMQLAIHGDYGVVPAGWDMQQVPVQGFLQDGLAMFRTSGELMRSNLSNYRQNAPMKQEGNPLTARQVMHDASTSSSLNKTTYNRFYKQYDQLYTEIVRRLCNLNSTDKRAQTFQKRCKDQDVAEECFGRIESVRAVRVIGQGSVFMRKEAIDGLAPFVATMPEDGRLNWMKDKVAVEAGQSAVRRYVPEQSASRLPSDQQFQALEGVTMMKVGVPPIVTSSQHPTIFAGTYLTAATQALESLKQGANPMEVLAFMEICGPAILAQLKRFANDPLRAQVFKTMLTQFHKLSALTDKVKGHVAQMQKQRKEQQAKSGQVMTDQEIKMHKLRSDETRKNLKLKSQLQRDAVSTKQKLAIADATAASDIHRKRMASLQE